MRMSLSVRQSTCFISKTTESIQVEVFWVVMPCSVAVGFHRFKGQGCLYLQDEMLKTEAAWLSVKRWYPTATLLGVTTQKTST